ERERRFTGDAAHELRTPLAALKTQAEVALSTESEERRRHALKQVVAGTDRATRLVQQLLQLARLDAQGLEGASDVELGEPCRRAIASLAPDARRRDIQVDIDATPARVRGDATLLEVLARNLVENAIRHAPEGGVVRVTVGEDGGHATLAVGD